MPWSGSSYTKANGTAGWIGDATNGIGIEAGRHDTQDTDFQNGINDCINKNGLNTPSQNLPMGGNRHTGVGLGLARTDYAQLSQVQDSSVAWGATSGGTSTAYTISLTPAITAYAAGQVIRWIAHATVTGAATININGLGTKTLQRQGTALAGNEFKTGDIVEIVYDGTQFQVTSVVGAPLFIDRTNNRVGVGAVAGDLFSVQGTATVASVYRYDNSATGGQLAFAKSRGVTVGTNTIVQNGDQLGRIDFYGADGTFYKPSAAIIAATDGTIATDRMPGQILFYTTPDVASGSLTERMRLSSAGNLGIGVASVSTNRTTIQGADTSGSNFGLQVRDSASLVLFSVRNDGTFNTGTGANSPYNNTTASAANLFVASNGVVSRSTSSLKYKTDVQDAVHGLAKVLELRPVTYKGKNDGSTVFGGLIAEEVDAAGLSEFVQYAEDGTPDALAYSNMVSLAFKAIQDLNAKVEALEARVAELEG